MHDTRTDEHVCTPFCDLAGYPEGFDPRCPDGTTCQPTSFVGDDIGICGGDPGD